MNAHRYEVDSTLVYSSILKIKSASMKDKGVYTCVAKNELGNATLTFTLIVKGNF